MVMQGEIVLTLYNLARGNASAIRFFKWALLLLLIFLVISVFKKRKIIFHMLLAVLVSFTTSVIIKFFFNIPRPFVIYGLEPIIKHAPNSSFPSNHATISFAIAATLLLYNKKIGILALLVACGICVMRIAAALHYPIDVFFGAGIGTLAAILLWCILK